MPLQVLHAVPSAPLRRRISGCGATRSTRHRYYHVHPSPTRSFASMISRTARQLFEATSKLFFCLKKRPFLTFQIIAKIAQNDSLTGPKRLANPSKMTIAFPKDRLRHPQKSFGRGCEIIRDTLRDRSGGAARPFLGNCQNVCFLQPTDF